MLKITIDGQSLDLEGIKFTVQLNSPFPFDPTDNTIEGSFAFGARFPASKRNKAIFDFPHRIEKYPEASSDYEGALFFDGRKLFDVIISLSEVTDFYFNSNIKIGLGYYSNLIQEKSLRDLELGGDIDLGTSSQDVVDHANARVQETFPTASHTFPPIYNPEFYGEGHEFNPTWLDIMNYYIHGDGFQVNSFDSDSINNWYNLVPCFYMMFVLEKCFTEYGYQPSGDFMLDGELQKVIIPNTRALDLITDRYKAIANNTLDQSILGEETVIFDDVQENIDGPYDTLTNKYLVQTKGNHQVKCDLSISHGGTYPGNWWVYVYLDDTVIGSANGSAGDSQPIAVSINFQQYLSEVSEGKDIYLVAIFEDSLGDPCTGTIYAGGELLIQNLSESQLNRYQKTITPADHLPDIKISEFLIRLQKLFGVVYAPDHSSKEVKVLFIKDILAKFAAAGYDVMAVKSSKTVGFNEARSYKLDFGWPSSDGYVKDNFLEYDPDKLIGEFASMEDLPETGVENTFALVLNSNILYQYKEDAWQYFTDHFYPYEIGAAKTEIKPNVSPLMMWADHPTELAYLLYPKILQKGSSVDLGDNEFGFSLLFYRGMLEDTGGNTYPFASCTKYGPTGESVGSYELKWDGDYGLYTQFLQEYYDFVINRSRPVEYDRYFTASEIRNVDFMEKVMIFSNTFLVKQISIPVSQSSIGLASMKLIKS